MPHANARSVKYQSTPAETNVQSISNLSSQVLLTGLPLSPPPLPVPPPPALPPPPLFGRCRAEVYSCIIAGSSLKASEAADVGLPISCSSAIVCGCCCCCCSGGCCCCCCLPKRDGTCKELPPAAAAVAAWTPLWPLLPAAAPTGLSGDCGPAAVPAPPLPAYVCRACDACCRVCALLCASASSCWLLALLTGLLLPRLLGSELRPEPALPGRRTLQELQGWQHGAGH